ncbi:MAG: hypothetical protein QW258_00630 [Thermoplasmata archaeon]
MTEEQSIIESVIEAIEGTKSTAVFDNLNIKLPGMNTSIIINRKVIVTILSIYSKENE